MKSKLLLTLFVACGFWCRCLGDTRYGVLLSVNPDVNLEAMLSSRPSNECFIVLYQVSHKFIFSQIKTNFEPNLFFPFQVMLGRIKCIDFEKDEKPKPTKDFDCHMSRKAAHPSQTFLEQKRNSMVKLTFISCSSLLVDALDLPVYLLL